MTRSLDITQRQIEALCKGAEKAGYVPVVRIGDAYVSLVPKDHEAVQTPEKIIDRGKDIRL